MIDIIIPAYNAHDTIGRALDSVCIQTINTKLNVYIIDDNSDKNYKKIVEFYKNFINIKEIKLNENKGPGMARETGIKHSNGKYIMFLDADDSFASVDSIEILYNMCIKEDLDWAIGRFIEKSEDGFIQHEYDQIWLHGKMYKRSFIKNNSIHFTDTYANEDCGFNQQVLLSNPKYKYIDYPIYFWMYNKDSITRKDDYIYSFLGIFGYLDNMNYVLKYALNNNKNRHLIDILVLKTLYVAYLYYLNYGEDAFLEKLNDYKKEYKNIQLSDNEIYQICENQREDMLYFLDYKKILNCNLGFEEFISKI